MAKDELTIPGLSADEVTRRFTALLGPLDARGLGYSGTQVGPGVFDVRYFALMRGRYGVQKSETRYRAAIEATPQGAKVRLDSGPKGALIVWGFCIVPPIVLSIALLTHLPRPAHGMSPAIPILGIMALLFGGGGGALALWSSQTVLRTAKVALAQRLGVHP